MHKKRVEKKEDYLIKMLKRIYLMIKVNSSLLISYLIKYKRKEDLFLMIIRDNKEILCLLIEVDILNLLKVIMIY